MNRPIAGDPAAIDVRPASATGASAHNCRNCETTFSGNFCPHCGQESRVQLPKVLDFLREAADETIGISGRLPRTLSLLMTRPGRLTLEYIAGRRQRYVRPMRLYLSVSLVFFGLLSIATSDIGWIKPPAFDADDKSVHVGGSKPSAPAEKPTPGEVKDAAVQAAKDKGDEIDASVGSVGKQIEKAIADARRDEAAEKSKAEMSKADAKPAAENPSTADAKKSDAKKDDEPPTNIPYLNARIAHFKAMPPDQLVRTMSQGIQSNAPYAVFVLMPLAALWYKLYYFGRRRRYAEHLLHSVHLHSFAFCLGILAMLPFLDGNRGWLLWLMALYTLLAERKVYGSGWTRAIFGTLIGGMLYIVGISLTAAALVAAAFAF